VGIRLFQTLIGEDFVSFNSDLFSSVTLQSHITFLSYLSSYDLGIGAGFYVDATEEPYSQHYKMYSYVTEGTQRILSVPY
jgi:S-formylglutathione hydrolase FrmB